MAFSILGMINALSLKDAASRPIGRDIAYGADPRQKLDIYAPRQERRNQAQLPVVVFIYGGSWSDGSRADYDFVGRALAAQGFVTVVVDYRLLPAVEYPAFLNDCALAVQWVADHIAEHGGDPGRIALMGHSAGAYNAVMLALDPSLLARRDLLKRVRCVVGLSGPYDFFPFDGAITLRTFGAVREPMATQPVHFVSPSAPPMFLGTGEKDSLVYPRNTVALARRLRVVGVTVEERHYQMLGHPGPLLALGRPARPIAPVLKDVATFLHCHLEVAAPAAVAQTA
ncbi:MAG: alpha/beta hydrolase [Devosia sp.]